MALLGIFTDREQAKIQARYAVSLGSVQKTWNSDDQCFGVVLREVGPEREYVAAFKAPLPTREVYAGVDGGGPPAPRAAFSADERVVGILVPTTGLGDHPFLTVQRRPRLRPFRDRAGLAPNPVRGDPSLALFERKIKPGVSGKFIDKAMLCFAVRVAELLEGVGARNQRLLRRLESRWEGASPEKAKRWLATYDLLGCRLDAYLGKAGALRKAQARVEMLLTRREWPAIRMVGASLAKLECQLTEQLEIVDRRLERGSGLWTA
jgi:hypothetical protein